MATSKWRKAGYIKPPKKASLPKRIIFYDTETTVPDRNGDNQDFGLIVGCATYIELDNSAEITRRIEYVFTEKEDFVKFLLARSSSKSALYVFAHNVGFDVRVLDLPRQFNDNGIVSEPPIINDMTFIWKVKLPKSTITFLDTANLGVRSVSSLEVS